jgi:hypothetical protein
MHYSDGQELQFGDLVRLGDDPSGVVVAVIDAGEFSEECPKAEWAYLKVGFLVRFAKFGLIHYTTPEPDLQLLRRA